MASLRILLGHVDESAWRACKVYVPGLLLRLWQCESRMAGGLAVCIGEKYGWLGTNEPVVSVGKVVRKCMRLLLQLKCCSHFVILQVTVIAHPFARRRMRSSIIRPSPRGTVPETPGDQKGKGRCTIQISDEAAFYDHRWPSAAYLILALPIVPARSGNNNLGTYSN